MPSTRSLFIALLLQACTPERQDTVTSEQPNETASQALAPSAVAPPSPLPIHGLPPADRLLSCDHDVACVVRKDGRVTCWGRNDFGQLGTGTLAKANLPPGKPVSGLEDVRSLATGLHHVCALTSKGEVYCWGANYAGQLGNGAAIPTAPEAEGPKADPTAARVPLPARAIAIDAGISHTCAVLDGGAVACWGSNETSELGVLRSRAESTPQLVPGLAGALEVSAGVDHSCARLADNRIVCWGSLPAGAAANICATQLASGSGFSCGLECNGGAARCWGSFPAQRNAPSPSPAIGDLRSLAEIRAGYWHVCMRDKGGQAHCWGGNDAGQLGVGKAEDWSQDWRDEPTPVLQAWKQTKELCAGGMSTRVSAGYRRAATFVEAGITCALTESDEVYCWGAPALDYVPRRVLAR